MHKHAGFSLIEVLVSMVVVSVGALSVASLQLISKSAVRDAGQRLEATQLAHGMLERLNANSSSEALAAYVTGAGGGLGSGRVGAMPTPDCSSASTSCTPTELAAFDLWLWEQLLDGATEQMGTENTGGLLLPTACLSAPATGAGAAGNYTLTIAFRGSVELPDNANITCGTGELYQDGTLVYGENNRYRRIIIAQTFITPAKPVFPTL